MAVSEAGDITLADIQQLFGDEPGEMIRIRHCVVFYRMF